jgi:hypothetical protein
LIKNENFQFVIPGLTRNPVFFWIPALRFASLFAFGFAGQAGRDDGVETLKFQTSKNLDPLNQMWDPE